MTKLTRKVKNLKTPKRAGNTLSTSWTVPAECKKSGAKDDVRFEGLSMEWVAYVTDEAKKGGTLGPIGKFKTVSADSTGKESKQNDSENLTRSKYHPNTGKPYLQGITFRIRGYNTQSGKRVYGPWVDKSLSFEKPAKPKISVTFDGETGKVTPKYETTHPDGKKEVYDTQVWVTAGTQKLYDGTAYTDAEKTLTAVEVTGSRTLGQGKFIKVTMKARNRGLAGDSAKAEKSIYICCPNPPSVTDAVKRGTDDSTAQVLVSINHQAPGAGGLDHRGRRGICCIFAGVGRRGDRRRQHRGADGRLRERRFRGWQVHVVPSGCNPRRLHGHGQALPGQEAQRHAILDGRGSREHRLAHFQRRRAQRNRHALGQAGERRGLRGLVVEVPGCLGIHRATRDLRDHGLNAGHQGP